MSTFMAVGAVTAVLRGLIETGADDLATILGGAVTFSSLPPDRIQTGSGTPDRINLFLFQAVENAAMRNLDFPSRNGRGERLSNAPLTLDLHYLVTAYGSGDYRAEVLLGHSMLMFHESPILPRKTIRDILNGLGAGDPIFEALRRSRLADQIEQIKIVPRILNVEEVSKIWTALQSQYRTTAAYQATVTLIESSRPARSALPVLTRGQPAPGGDEGVFVHASLQPPVPTLESLQLPAEKQPSIRLGETLSLLGHHLAGTNRRVRFRHLRETSALVLTASPGSDDSRIEVQMPPDPPVAPVPAGSPLNPANWQAGMYEVTALVTQDGRERESNALPVVLAPRIIPPATVGGAPAAIGINCSPPVRPQQTVALIVGQRELRPTAFNAPASNVSFPLPTGAGALPSGTHPIRLRVDGIDSLLVADYAARPPAFDPAQRVTLP